VTIYFFINIKLYNGITLNHIKLNHIKLFQFIMQAGNSIKTYKLYMKLEANLQVALIQVLAKTATIVMLSSQNIRLLLVQK
jgi:hypothetical protein